MGDLCKTWSGSGRSSRSCDVTCSDLRQRVDLHDEILLQAEEAHDGEQVDEDESEQRRQQDGATVTSDALYHVEQSLLPIDQVEQLQTDRRVNTEQNLTMKCVCVCVCVFTRML